MYTPRPLPTSRVRVPRPVAALAEELARHVHDLWAQTRISQGWTLGPRRDDRLKTHPCLVPYEELPEREKVYDRKTALGTLKAILALGYRIEKPPRNIKRPRTRRR